MFSKEDEELEHQLEAELMNMNNKSKIPKRRII